MNKKGTSWLNKGLVSLAIVAALLIPALPAAGAGYVQTNLVSDGSVGSPPAANVDPNLVNPWGLSHSTGSPFWISDNGKGVSTLYNGAGQPFPVGSPMVVTIPPPPGSPVGTVSAPTGQVFNSFSSTSPAFNRDVFIFATEDGTIAGWRGALGTTAETLADNSGAGAVYKGLALGNNAGSSYLYAANFHSGAIDVFHDPAAPPLTGTFTDPTLPAGFAPFNVQNIGSSLLVTYAVVDPLNPKDDLPGPGFGIVDRFDLNGNLLQRLISNGPLSPLNAPWGLALAPSNFGEFSNDLLVGNFGDGRINAFDPTTGAFIGTMTDKDGNPIEIDGLWGLSFGNGVNGGDLDKLYFTAGPEDETHGLFGSLAVPLPSTVMLLGSGLAGLLTFARARRRRA